MEGFIKLHRCLLNKPIWRNSTPEQKTILVTLILMASHKAAEWEFNGEKYILKPGQFITSLESIARRCGKGISTQNVRTALARFIKLGFLTYESTKVNRLVTLCNWASYQIGSDDLTNQLTNSQQITNKHLTTFKKNKNDNNIYGFDSLCKKMLNDKVKIQGYASLYQVSEEDAKEELNRFLLSLKLKNDTQRSEDDIAGYFINYMNKKLRGKPEKAKMEDIETDFVSRL